MRCTPAVTVAIGVVAVLLPFSNARAQQRADTIRAQTVDTTGGPELSLDKAMSVQTEFVKRAYENSVAESQKICELHNRLAKQTLDPFKGLTGKTPATHGKP